METKPFNKTVLELVALVPKGAVVSYGQVAAAAGHPRAARQVGGILGSMASGEQVPWWRVVNAVGYISIRGNWEADKPLQAELLRREGVEVSEDFHVPMEKYRHHFSS